MKNFKLMFGGKLLSSLLLTVFVGGLLVTNASAVEPAGGNTTIDRFSVPFSIPWSELPCADLPPGVTEISGVANFRLVTTVRVDDGGVTYLNQNGFADGTATDNLGGSYLINYANHFDAEIPPDGFPQQIRMIDHFNLNGRGRNSRMHVGFVIVGTIESPDDTFPWQTTAINIRGDAIGCDPI
jgi:hypothetical protein